jgi:ABC-type sugar transport system ATPase subunit
MANVSPSGPGPVQLLALEEVRKDFPGTRALDGASLDLRAGEVHALVGENGAGKSTLIKIAGGVIPRGAFSGRLRVGGREEAFHSVRDARRAGVAVIHQELELIPGMTVAENIALGEEPARAGWIDRAAARRRAATALGELGLALDPGARVARLGTAERQMVEIARALSQNFRILILDEPTASLAAGEVEALFAILGRLRSRGTGILYVSHRLGEIFRIADRVTVLRDGRNAARFVRGEADADALIRAMAGRPVAELYPRRPPDRPGRARLVLEGYRWERRGALGPPLDLSVREGEVLGIGGLLGAGRTELLESLFGLRRAGGRVLLDGRPVRIASPAGAVRAGLAFLSEDRKDSGLATGQSVLANLTLATLRAYCRFGLIRAAEERARAGDLAARLELRGDLDADVGTLSGGNQQKVVLGRWLLREPAVLLLDEPTRGVDVRSKAEIYALIRELASQGRAVVFATSDLEELEGFADRILILSDGRSAGEFAPGAGPETLLRAMTSAFLRA